MAKVIVGDYGEKIMKYCLNVGYNLLKYGTSTIEDEHPDILAEFPSLVQAEKNKFIIELQDFVTEKKALFLLEEDGSVRQTRNTVSVEGVIDSMYQVVEIYISKFWKEMNERIQLTDLSAGPTSFSEAPAESVFSVWSRILTGREALTVGNTIALVRVSMEGPEASTKDSLNLSKRALAKWHIYSKHGERFTTCNWKPGVISKSVAKIQND